MSAASPPAWLDELALDADGPPWLAMGLARVPDAEWLLLDDDRPAELAERARLLAERHDEGFAALPGTEAASDGAAGRPGSVGRARSTTTRSSLRPLTPPPKARRHLPWRRGPIQGGAR